MGYPQTLKGIFKIVYGFIFTQFYIIQKQLKKKNNNYKLLLFLIFMIIISIN